MQQSQELPCLIVLDINMPRMDGKQTLVAIQNNPILSTIPVVLFSTSSSALDKTFSESKKVELITKPFTFDTLFKVTSKLLSFCIK
jgi:CheY-like chemotaxis protein